MKIRVKEKKLGKHGVHAYAYENGKIELDPRLKDFKLMKIEIHEALHVKRWSMKEREIISIAYFLARFLYTQRKYRKLK